jgi:hypothetical protein
MIIVTVFKQECHSQPTCSKFLTNERRCKYLLPWILDSQQEPVLTVGNP